MTHEKNMMDYQSFLQKKNLAMRPGDMLYGKSYCFDKANVQYDFLKSQPKLGDFVPTNEKGEVMEEPESLKGYYECDLDWTDSEKLARKEYQSALDRVLWKNWEVNDKGILKKGKGFIGAFIRDKFLFAHKTYNELITSGVKLERIQKK